MRNLKFTKQIFIVAMFLNILKFYSQTIITDRDNDYDKKYTPSENSIFNNLKKNKTNASSSSAVEIKNAIKYCPVALLRQKMLFSYQREIHKGLALNLTVGKAFGKDILQAVGFSFVRERSNNEITAYEIHEYSTYEGSSPLISPSLRFYYSGKSFEDGYVEIGYAYERLDFLLNPNINGVDVIGSRVASTKMNAFYFGFGHTFVTGAKNNILHDFYCNIGIKTFEVTSFNKIQTTTNNGVNAVYSHGGADFTARIAPTVNFSYSFGFGF